MKNLKKLFITLLAVTTLSGCGSTNNEDVLVVSATLDPHSKILEEAKPILLEQYGIELEIKVLDDYYIFNKSLNDGDVDANFFQHIPFFNSEVETNGYDIVNAGGIHIEPFGIYSNDYKNVSELKDGSTVVISNSVSDNGRILAILAESGLINLPENTNVLDVTISDIDNSSNNPKGLKFIEIKPELLVSAFNNNEGDLVAINGNYAIQGGLNPTTDALILEEATQDNPYVNIIACRSDNLDSDFIKALVEVLQSQHIKDFINETYSDGSVIPAK